MIRTSEIALGSALPATARGGSSHHSVGTTAAPMTRRGGWFAATPAVAAALGTVDGLGMTAF